jgi:uncharacterized membrane protein
MSFARRHWLPLTLAAAGFLSGAYAGHACWPAPSTPAAAAKDAAEVRGELAEERIPQIEEKAKTARRAARAQHEQEVHDASAARSLGDYINSRGR